MQYVRSFSMPKTKKHSWLLWAKVIKELIKSRLEWQTTMSGRTVPITQSKETLSIQFLCRVTNTNPVYEITLYSPGLDKEIWHTIYTKIWNYLHFTHTAYKTPKLEKMWPREMVVTWGRYYMKGIGRHDLEIAVIPTLRIQPQGSSEKTERTCWFKHLRQQAPGQAGLSASYQLISPPRQRTQCSQNLCVLLPSANLFSDFCISFLAI